MQRKGANGFQVGLPGWDYRGPGSGFASVPRDEQILRTNSLDSSTLSICKVKCCLIRCKGSVLTQLMRVLLS